MAPLRGTGPMVGKLSRLGHFEVLSFGFGMKFRPWDQSGSGLAPLGAAAVAPLWKITALGCPREWAGHGGEWGLAAEEGGRVEGHRVAP